MQEETMNWVQYFPMRRMLSSSVIPSGLISDNPFVVEGNLFISATSALRIDVRIELIHVSGKFVSEVPT